MSSNLPELSLAPPTLAAATTVKFNAGQFVSRRKDKVSKHYQIKSALGSGGYGDVFLATHKQSGAERAIKVIDKSKWNSRENEAVINEFNIVKDLDHPNLLKMYEMFEDHRHYYIITDIYKGGELFDEIEANGAFAEEDTAVLMMNVLSCVNYCHKKGIVHRDLKPENILLTSSKKLDDLKLIDFGLASYFKPGQRLKDSVGSAYYKAPEVLNEDYGEKCDVWTCGVICFILLAGYAPFDGDDDQQIEDEIRSGDFEFDDPIWDMISEDAKDFIEECLTYNEKHRPTAAEALTHPWLENTRKAGKKNFVKKEGDSIQNSLNNMANFHASSKLKQATLAFIASQLLLKEEKHAIDEVFRALDTNCDGKLTPDEIKDGYRDFFDKELSQEEVDTIFKRVNFRGTGAIDYSEFVVASMFEKNLLDDARLEAAFKNFDKDGDGFIDADNIRKVLSNFGSVGSKDSMDDYINTKIIGEFDEGGNGQISFTDFKRMMFQTVKEQPKRRGRRGSFLEAVDHGSLEAADGPEPEPLLRPGQKKRSGSIKDVTGAMEYMTIFDSAKEGSGSNPLFASRQRFASVRGSANSQKKKLMPTRTTTRDTVKAYDEKTRPPLTASYSGDLKLLAKKASSGGLLEEEDEDSD
ncbi:MAP kinase-activated protein kinase 2 (Fragment) [Seminavis robusta]|uniref:non-specific serine/threonine protein kinase n=1 Tax=Seminavis robusta TaxID=568900 RepID=A0A9N8DZV3_9STRA